MKTRLFLSILLFSSSLLYPQQQQNDKTSGVELLNFIKNTSLQGHVRNFTMATFNDADLRDYATNASGGLITITTPNFKGFEAGVAASLTFKTIGNDLAALDLEAGKGNKWELELYDSFNADNNFNQLMRLDELYLKYQYKQHYISYGKIEIENTNIINTSDGRMNRFAHRGAWLHLDFNATHTFDVAWLDGVSPRASYDWFDFDEAFGMASQGFQPNGEPAAYRGLYPSHGVGIFNYQFHADQFYIKVTNFLFDKINTTTWLEAEYSVSDFEFGLQYALTVALSHNQILSYAQRYMQPDEQAHVFSSHVSWNQQRWKFDLAYTHALDTGRFLFPKELGRDDFFTSIPRSRLEGLGGVDVFAIHTDYTFLKPDLHLSFAYQEVSGVEVGQFQLNKYNIDSTRQLNSQIKFKPHRFVEGLSFELLWVYRRYKNEHPPELIFNKGHFHQLNFVTNYNF